jgi:hypothetical protein
MLDKTFDMSLIQKFKELLGKGPNAARMWALFEKRNATFVVCADLPDPEAVPVDSPLAIHYLNDLVNVEAALEVEGAFQINWSTIYALHKEDDHAAGLQALSLPGFADYTPVLRCEGTLDDTDFTIAIDGWVDGERTLGSVLLQGPVAIHGGKAALLRPATYRLLLGLQEFLAQSDRTPQANRHHWGLIREAALEAGARMDQFLTFTVVLTPQKLHFHLNETEVAGTGVVEIQPWFAGAPDNWLHEFDRRSGVPLLYQILDGEQLVEVVVTPEVRSVLTAVKSFPGRRAAGALAEKFISNPFAALGEDAVKVIDEKQFEQARKEAGLVFQRFTAHLVQENGAVIEVGVLIETLEENYAESRIESFNNPDELKKFVFRVRSKLDAGLEICEWRRWRLQLLGDTPEQLDLLERVYQIWCAPQVSIKAVDVYNFERYSRRVTGIGVQRAIVSPHIPKPEQDPWFPEPRDAGKPAAAMAAVDLPEGRKFELLVDEKVYATLKRAVEQAVQLNQPFIDVPGVPNTVPLDNAKVLVEELAPRFVPQSPPEPGTPPQRAAEPPKKKRTEREELLIQLNVDSPEYQEERADELRFDDTTLPRLSRALKSHIQLKDHQLVGVAWMQHLLEKSPQYCRGAILADDMGLGKTLQLLTLIARALEDNSAMDPVLVVAPVSLLENWKEEAEKFFTKEALPILTLYGDTLAPLRAKRHEIDESLLQRGFTRFLRDGWLGLAKVVLTTYETLRDLEFSLAAQRWSIMVCDEAQKIKNPAAMVTRAAKKQNVGFRIACTGTPVENSLSDLWCLFDFIQPGLLGALNDFGNKYQRPIECHTDEQKARINELRERIEPQVLRRLKKDVAKELPEKKDGMSDPYLTMSNYQRELYARALEMYRLGRTEKDGSSPIKNQLGLLHYLRKICTDPRELGKQFAQEPLALARARNPKLHWLLETLQVIKEKNEKAIVFCEFRDMQAMLAHYIEQVFKLRPDIINGDVTAAATKSDSRQKRITKFRTHPGFHIIILSPVAVGFGVNIQEANHVIHFTRTWNPAKEDQATDRAYRIGQTRRVYVYCPVVHAPEFTTFDVKLHSLLEHKRSLAGDMLNGAGDVRPDDFIEVVNVGTSVFDEQICIEDADELNPTYFEALIAALWKRRFMYVKLTPSSNDGGVDVVAKSQTKGDLVQAKSSRAEEASLSWNAVKDVVGGEARYKVMYPGVGFTKVALTNRRFNENAKLQAQLNGVRLVEREELARMLGEARLAMADVQGFIDMPEQFSQTSNTDIGGAVG